MTTLAKSPRYIPSLDGLRAVSILLVVLSHIRFSNGTPKFLSDGLALLPSGDIGVTIFFVISGFLITSLMLQEGDLHGNIDVTKFYIRRILRILPVNYLYIFIVFLANGLERLDIQPVNYWQALTYTVNFSLTGSWMLGHLWSLAVEEQFYLFWPWIMKLSKKMITRTALFIILFAPIVRVAAHFYPQYRLILLAPFLGFADSLMIGSLLAVSRGAYPGVWNSSWLKNGALLPLAITTIWATQLMSHISHCGFFTLPFGRTLISISAACILARTITVKQGFVFSLLNTSVMKYFGTLSYSLYIWQEFFLCPAEFPFAGAWWRWFPVNVLLALIAAALSYHFWEKRFLKLKARFSR